jgi:tetratricopeptide (TPR) repeat protein
MNLAQAHRLLGEADRAEVLLLEAVDLRPDFAPARRELGDLWSTQGRTDEALAQYELALASDSESPAVWQRVIWGHLHLGHGETARRLADRSPPGTLSPAFNERLRREGRQLADDFGL